MFLSYGEVSSMSIKILFSYSIQITKYNVIFLMLRILKKDPYHNSCLPVHIACLVELKKTNGKFTILLQ